MSATTEDGTLCVLAFHRVKGRIERDHDVTWQSFLALLQGLQQALAQGAPGSERRWTGLAAC